MRTKLMNRLGRLSEQLAAARDDQHKVDLLLQDAEVQQFLSLASPVDALIRQLNVDLQAVLLQVMAIGEGAVVFQGRQEVADLMEELKSLALSLKETEQFYRGIGGVAGYHKTVLELMQNAKNEPAIDVNFLQPPRVDISEGSPDRDVFVREGIMGMKRMAEIYPVGGAGDRLNLIDEDSGEPLPAAQLSFGGISLLERLVRDLQGREKTFEKMTGEAIETPVVLMTSIEKDNDRRIREMLREHHWFGRSPDSFYLVIQPLVPVITCEGSWVMQAPFKLRRKPGGHGALWKLMEDQGAFEWLKEKGRSKALVRQINNPLAGEDDSLWAFTGVGLRGDKTFGFCSCPRKVNASEGMNVLIESLENGKPSYCLTNVEYTDFKKHGIEDVPEAKGSPYSLFPANTNILFVDLEKVRSYTAVCPIPGMLINLKSKEAYLSPDGKVYQKHAGRLESTMQNIADAIVFGESGLENPPVYLTYNSREKTIGTTKQAFNPEHPSEETPEMCFYTLLSLHRDLLAEKCGVKIPQFISREDYLEKGPNALFLYAPQLGPAYAVIAEKIRGGQFSSGAELQIEPADTFIENLHLQGSLIIRGGHKGARCHLKNVTVVNKGINWQTTRDYWKNAPERHELLEIVFEGEGEFAASDITLEGAQRIVVPDQACLVMKD